jgi:hypothetical protein
VRHHLVDECYGRHVPVAGRCGILDCADRQRSGRHGSGDVQLRRYAIRTLCYCTAWPAADRRTPTSRFQLALLVLQRPSSPRHRKLRPTQRQREAPRRRSLGSTSARDSIFSRQACPAPRVAPHRGRVVPASRAC